MQVLLLGAARMTEQPISYRSRSSKSVVPITSGKRPSAERGRRRPVDHELEVNPVIEKLQQVRMRKPFMEFCRCCNFRRLHGCPMARCRK